MRRDTKLRTLNTSTRPNKIIGMDFIGFVEGRYLLITVDFIFRKVQVDVHKNADRGSIVRSLRRWVSKCGSIKKLVTDQGRHFAGGCSRVV